MKKKLVFYKGTGRLRKRTDWLMYEFRMCNTELGSAGVLQDTQPLVAPLLHAHPVDLPCIPFLSKRERPEVNPESLSPDNSKRPKHDDTNYNIANGSEESTSTSHNRSSTMMITITNFPSVEIPLLESLGAKDNLPGCTPIFNSAELERSVPLRRYLEEEIMNLSMDKERLKIKVM